MEWEQWNKLKCNCLNSSLEECSNCDNIHDCIKYQSWFVKVPYFIIDQLQTKVKPASFRVFLYLNRKANFNSKHDHFGMCWVNYKEISDVTGVSCDNMRTYIKELKDKGFIKHVQSTQKIGYSKFVNTNTFTICWMKNLEQLKQLELELPA